MKHLRTIPIVRHLRGAFLVYSLLGLRQLGKIALACLLSRTHVSVRVPGVKKALLLRPGTTDLLVLWSIFGKNECRIEEAINPVLIIDGGAYAGYSTAYFATQYPQTRIVAIEADLENFRILKENVSGYPNVEVLHAAIASRAGVMTLTNSNSAFWARRFEFQEQKDFMAGAGEVMAITLDEVICSHGGVRDVVLKLDIEGGEEDVLGSPGAWVDSMAVICVEIHRKSVVKLLVAKFVDLGFVHSRQQEKHVFRRAST